ncbi:MAG: hypothetical protein ACM3X3_05770 [Betaproteobacteria bacterium]
MTAEHGCGHFKPQAVANSRQKVAVEAPVAVSEVATPAPQPEKPRKSGKQRR